MLKFGFNEEFYLKNNPDVELAVREGLFISGLQHFKLFGFMEGRQPLNSSILNRNQKALSLIKKTSQGLEIGPSHNPIAARANGYTVDIVDHLDAAGLREKYKDHNVNLDLIEDVNYVWDGTTSLLELIGSERRYDYIIASHVIEHIPNLVSFLQSCECLLTNDGVLSLIIPDKRFCFDYFNPITKTGELLDAWLKNVNKPSPGQIFDHIANASQRNQIAWDITNKDKIQLVHSFNEAKDIFEFAIKHDEYLDVHLWRFTPASFKLILEDLNRLSILKNLNISLEYDTVGCEFFMSLTKSPFQITDRLELLNTRNLESLLI